MSQHRLENYVDAVFDYKLAVENDPNLYQDADFTDRKNRAENRKLYKGLGILKDF
jgi:hypothetical protein